MALFSVVYTYSPSTTDGRDTHRATHREWLRDLLEKKTLVSSGPFADGSARYLKYGGSVIPVNLWAITDEWRAAPVVLE